MQQVLTNSSSNFLQITDSTMKKIENNNNLRLVINAYKHVEFIRKRFNNDQISHPRGEKNHPFDQASKTIIGQSEKYSQTKRSGRHKRSTDNEGFLDDPNNIAMFIVFPCMVFIYGGCAVIYCCYKCKHYVRENQPFRKLKERIQNRNNKRNATDNAMDTMESQTSNSSEAQATTVAQTHKQEPKIRVFQKDESKSVKEHSSLNAQSSIDSKVTFVDVEYEDEIHSAMSTPLPHRDETVENAETTPTSESHVATDTSTYSYPSLCTVSTRVSTVNERETPIPISLSSRNESIDNKQIVYTSSESGHSVYTSFPKVCLVDMACQTDDTSPTENKSRNILVKSKFGRNLNKKKQNIRKKSSRPGQIHYVERYVSLNPYRDQVEADTVFLSRNHNKKKNLYDAIEDAVRQENKGENRKYSITSIE
ncbi:uncharacterized protein LOC127698279 [Mytilus californianus]|uniref:uncharacterized protein LOC127698279 n=1 Tax=Mytilus californianus TaxID=6549 RepID=UPI0022452A5A|nr:uncharacterized protein LOC127698279 [Mytilus californianus]